MHAKFQLDRTSPSQKRGDGPFSLRSLFPSKIKTLQNSLEAVDSNLANSDNIDRPFLKSPKSKNSTACKKESLVETNAFLAKILQDAYI